MTKDEFIERKRTFEKRDSRFNTIVMSALFGGLLAMVALHYRISAFDGWIAVGAMFVLFFGCFGAFHFNGGMNQAKHEGLVCGACGGGLLNARGEHAVITGICSHCGGKPFDDPA